MTAAVGCAVCTRLFVCFSSWLVYGFFPTELRSFFLGARLQSILVLFASGVCRDCNTGRGEETLFLLSLTVVGVAGLHDCDLILPQYRPFVVGKAPSGAPVGYWLILLMTVLASFAFNFSRSCLDATWGMSYPSTLATFCAGISD